jgi:hypothetical protein
MTPAPQLVGDINYLRNQPEAAFSLKLKVFPMPGLAFVLLEAAGINV